MSPGTDQQPQPLFRAVIESLGGIEQVAAECSNAFPIVSAEAYRDDLARLCSVEPDQAIVYLNDAIASMHHPKKAHDLRVAAIAGLYVAHEIVAMRELCSGVDFFLAYHLRRVREHGWKSGIAICLRDLFRWIFAFHAHTAECSGWILSAAMMLEIHCDGTNTLVGTLWSRFKNLNRDDELNAFMTPDEIEEYESMQSEIFALVSSEESS